MTLREQSVTKEIPILYRQAKVVEESINDEARTIDLIWTTGVQRMTWSWEEFSMVIEQLVVTDEACDLSRLNRGAPLLNAHSWWTLSCQIGVIEKSWIEDGLGHATVRFSKRSDVTPIWLDVKDQIIRNVSVGYTVQEYQVTYEEGQLPLYTAVRWQPCEISPVPIPADPGAQFARSQHTRSDGSKAPTFPCKIQFRNNKKEVPMAEIRMLSDEDRLACKNILKEYGVKEENLDMVLDKLLALYEKKAEETDDTEAKEEMAQALGCKKDATLRELAEGAKTLRELRDLDAKRSHDLESKKEVDVFATNESKGLHRNLGSALAKKLFTHNRSLYDEEVKKVKPLSGTSPAAGERSLDKLSTASNQEAQFRAEMDAEIEKSKGPDGVATLDYSHAFDLVNNRWNARKG